MIRRFKKLDGTIEIQEQIQNGNQIFTFNDGSESIVPKFIWREVPLVEEQKVEEKPKEE